jgi:hypothetical protein
MIPKKMGYQCFFKTDVINFAGGRCIPLDPQNSQLQAAGPE